MKNDPADGLSRRALAFFVLAVLAVAATAGHIVVAGHSWTYSGPLLILDHLFSLLLPLAVLTIAFGLGKLALERSGLELGRRMDEVLFSVALGLGVLATAILVIGFLNLLIPIVMGVLLLLCAVLARHQIQTIPRTLSEAVGELRAPPGTGNGLMIFAAVVCLVAGVFTLVMSVAPPVDWDAQMYHLHVPAEFVQAGGVHLPPDNLHTAYVGLIQMLYAVFLAFGAPSGPSVFSAFVTLLLALTLFGAGTRLMDRSTGTVALAAIWGTTTILLVAITPRIDVTVAWFLFLGHYILMIALTASHPQRHLLLAAVLLGFSVGAKYNAIPYVAGLSPLIAWIGFKTADEARGRIRSLAVFGLAFGLAVSPWLIKNLILLGAPLYPFLAERAVEPWLVPLLGTSTMPADVNSAIFHILGGARQPFNIVDAFFAPGRITIEFEGIFHYTSPLLLLLPLWVFFWKNGTVNWLILPAIAYLLFILLPYRTTNLRYLIPAMPALTLAAAFILVRLAERFLSRSASRILIVGVLALTLISSSRAIYTWLRYTSALPHLVGATSDADYVARYLDPSVRTLSSVINFVNRETPPDTRVLMLYESRAFYFERPIIQDTRVVNWPLLERELGPEECLEGMDVDHVLMSLGAVRYYIRRGNDPDLFKWEEFVDFADRCLGGEPIYRDQAFLLFRVG